VYNPADCSINLEKFFNINLSIELYQSEANFSTDLLRSLSDLRSFPNESRNVYSDSIAPMVHPFSVAQVSVNMFFLPMPLGNEKMLEF